MFYTTLNALDVHLIAFNANDTPRYETICIQYILIKDVRNIQHLIYDVEYANAYIFI